MKIVKNILCFSYFNLVYWVIVFPYSLLMAFFLMFPTQKEESYFLDKKTTRGLLSVEFLKRILSPLRSFSMFTQDDLFVSQKKKFSATPHQLSALLLPQIGGNVRLMKAFCDNQPCKYTFALQPTLFYSTATELDRQLAKKRIEKKQWGFPYCDFYKVYYRQLKELFKSDVTLKNSFLDCSDIFTNSKEQKFCDVAHLGDQGHFELAQVLADEVLRKEKK